MDWWPRRPQRSQHARDSRPRLRIRHPSPVGRGGLLLAFAALVELLRQGEGTQLAVIPTLIALGSKKFFGQDKGDPNTALADHPTVAFVLGAITGGRAEEAGEYIDPDAVAFANGYQILNPARGDSPEQFVENVAFWRQNVPDLSISVFDEIVKKHRHKTQDVAVRFVMTGSLPPEAPGGPGEPGGRFLFEGAAFVRVVGGRATEWRLILDSQVMEKLLAAVAGVEDPES